MSSAQTQGTSGVVRGGRINKTDQTRHSWSSREEEALLAALKELVVQGWKSDNGFRAGYLNKLEEAMKKEDPQTDLKAMPHINSKTTTWKKNYNSLCTMLDVTGVGFNLDGKHMIDCTNEQWEHIVKKDNNARNMRKKSWPYLEQWSEIFGKDRATGDVAEDLMEAARQTYHNIDLTQTEEVKGDCNVSLDDLNESGHIDDSVSQTHKPEAGVRVPSKKKKNGDDRMFEAMTEISHSTNTRLDTIAGRMGYDFDVSKARKDVFAQLGSINGLSKKDKFKVVDLLVKETERLDLFSSLSVEEKTDYVHYLIAEKLK
ncbi:uncharacterized protein LOC130998869 [Salvia miltiorrhiza]|uniref:uncharacterized protein LOC130998869 n=1 Tax=Salvia miltiorrhiza TaxID=226208 RepID=UPI0025AB669F|nr:uncharacterized protein LOC130998869 [Salvia miltiorrhiza]